MTNKIGIEFDFTKVDDSEFTKEDENDIIDLVNKEMRKHGYYSYLIQTHGGV